MTTLTITADFLQRCQVAQLTLAGASAHAETPNDDPFDAISNVSYESDNTIADPYYEEVYRAQIKMDSEYDGLFAMLRSSLTMRALTPPLTHTTAMASPSMPPLMITYMEARHRSSHAQQ